LLVETEHGAEGTVMLLAVLIIGSLVGLAIAGAILSSACSLVRVEPPEFFFSMTLCFVISVAVFMLQFAAGVAGTLGAGVSLERLKSLSDFRGLMERGAVVAVVSLPFVSAGMYSAALRDCSFRRGLLIWVAQFVVIAIFVLVIWGAVNVLGLTGWRA
jgi:hypothetical protein